MESFLCIGNEFLISFMINPWESYHVINSQQIAPQLERPLFKKPRQAPSLREWGMAHYMFQGRVTLEFEICSSALQLNTISLLLAGEVQNFHMSY